MKVFYDSEFTGLHQHSTLISIGLVAENNEQFYAEFADYDATQCDEWIQDNVIKHTQWLINGTILFNGPLTDNKEGYTSVYGNKKQIQEKLTEWLQQFETIEIWADCYAYDWVLFCELFGGARNIPQNIFYMPADISTLFQLKGLDMDTDREAFCSLKPETSLKHNALYDALLIRSCYQQLIQIKSPDTLSTGTNELLLD